VTANQLVVVDVDKRLVLAGLSLEVIAEGLKGLLGELAADLDIH
jgi:hypothetical protein